MAEIVRWSSRKTTRLFSGQQPGPEQVELREKVSVRSSKVGRLDASVLRDMVAALDEARIPGRTEVTVLLDGGRVTQMVVEAELDPDPSAVGTGGGEPVGVGEPA